MERSAKSASCSPRSAYDVKRLRRYQIGALQLKGIPLRAGKVLSTKEVDSLFQNPRTPRAAFEVFHRLLPDPLPSMKTKFLRSASLSPCGAVSVLFAAPLPSPPPSTRNPTPRSPAISFLKAGTDPVPPPAHRATCRPAGWRSSCRARLRAMSKTRISEGLDVKPGTSIRVAPKADAGVLTRRRSRDKTSITGLRGKWTQITLEKKLTRLHQGRRRPRTPRPSPTPARFARRAAPIAPSPVAPGVYGSTTPARPRRW